MPGLSQLKKLSEDVLRLGNEPKLRAERGEKPVVAVIPPTVEDIDDSEDFVLGMPEKTDAAQDPEKEAQSQEESEALKAAASDLETLLASNSNPAPGEPDLSSLLNPMGEASDDVPDLSAFEEPEESPKKEEPAIADMSLDDLLSMPSEDFAEPEPVPQEQTDEPGPSLDEFTGPDIFADIEAAESASEPEELAEVESIPEPEELTEPEKSSQEEDEFAFSGDSIDMNADIPEELLEVPGDPMANKFKAFKDTPASSEPEEPVEEEGNTSEEFTAPPEGDFDIPSDFEMPEMGDADFEEAPQADFADDISLDVPSQDEALEEPVAEESVPDEIPTSGDTGFDALDTSGLDDFGSMGDISSDAASFDLDSSMESDFDPASVDLSGLGLGDDEGDATDAGVDQTQAPEVFDTTEMGNVTFDDFNIPDTDSKLNGETDFELDSESAGEPDFEIAGYTGIDANPFDKSGRIKSQIAEPEEERKKNTLTDAEYKRFKANLKYYPLNVRIAVEDMIVKNEFTDDVIFEVIDKVIKKVPARQLASHLEKMLDIQLSVPRDYERRTAEEYEAYKQSLQYQLKNRILPAIIIGIFIVMIGLSSVYLGNEYIVKPWRAEINYKQGYALIQNNEYPQSEIKFLEAVKLKQKKRWFFRYAEAYRDHKQYDRAEKMYKSILRGYNHDKKAGLDYARMELDDLANYAKAEEILKREVLDNHINDKDAILLLGDVYLEWATEEDPSKFQDAFDEYSILCQLYEVTYDYQARLMRYYVRTDKLKEVLSYKEVFYPDEKSLSGDDWTEMSGYLMDKLYGELTPQEEYLRASIEDVHSMLIRAVKKAPLNPISRYNIARYYIESGDHLRATEGLKKTLELFDQARHIKKRDMYKQLNSYRLLGEEYIYNRDYILAQETLAEGIENFEERNAASGFDSDKNVGIMYSDMADLDYFISGDLENAQRNYENAINNKNDNASVRYRVGYIEYGNKEYEAAFRNFIIASQEKENDNNLMLALGNTLALRDDNYAGSGYYQRLIDSLNMEINKKDILLPQVKEDDTAIVESYMKASNNLGVTQFRVARQTGNSSLNGESIFHFQDSLRAWDALTRNQQTMVRLGGTNLAEQNIKYVTSPITTFEPAIYTEIPRVLVNEKGLE